MGYRKVAGFSFATKRSGSWKIAQNRFAKASNSVRDRQWLAVRRAALLAERELKKGLRSGAPGGTKLKPLSAMTRLLRRGRRPLIDGGDLLGSITTTLDKRSRSAFVGVHRSARGQDGEKLVNVALVHEFGTKPFAIPVTDGVRKFFWAMFFKTRGKIRPLSPNKTVIMHPGVPARPFMRPTLKRITPDLQKIIRVAFVENGGPL